MVTCAITRKTPEIYLDYWAKMLVAKTLEYHSFKTDLGTTMHMTAKNRLSPRMAGQVAVKQNKKFAVADVALMDTTPLTATPEKKRWKSTNGP